MEEQKKLFDMKSLVHALHNSRPLKPPGDLTRRVIGSLPCNRGILGRLEYTLRRKAFRSFLNRSGKLHPPSSAAEQGLLFLGAGVYFLCQTAVILLRLNFLDLAISPALIAGVLLLLTGWRQIVSPLEILPYRLRLTAAGALFALTMVLGMTTGAAPPLDLITAWLGASGLVIAVGLVLIPKLSFTNHEVRHAKIPCSN